MTKSFDSVLVANRGEIAVRILRSARAAGYRTVAVFSDVDADAPHVALADEAVAIGPGPAQASYLDGARILDAARRSGAEAIHPGYGFLSENAAFAQACKEAGLVFIGPSPEAIGLMGNKAAAKRRMLEAGVPCVPGFQGAQASDDVLLAAARDIGLPLMVKAAAGGGGRGMRLVEDFAALPAALAAARSEALNAFGSDELILERAVRRPRHVEVQVFGDGHGNLVHLGERDCSVQRRHQKVVEEAPCPVMTPGLRRAMGDAALAAARSIEYSGAGTVEFLLDESGAFYFLEMNTRLQVEHPVTECVTGLDLVDLQLRVARGETLGFSQDDVRLEGHAIEVRLYAEDTMRDFLPASGRVQLWYPPEGEGLRVDHGLCSGFDVSPFYDPMLAKIVATGPDRETARRRLLRALRHTVMLGLESNRQFLIDVLEDERFARGEATTAFLEEAFAGGPRSLAVTPGDAVLAAVLQLREEAQRVAAARLADAGELLGGQAMHGLASSFAYGVDDGDLDVRVRASGVERFEADVAGETRVVRILAHRGPGRLRVDVDGRQSDLYYAPVRRGEVELQIGGRRVLLTSRLQADHDEASAATGVVRAPMHGNLLALRVAVGDTVQRGDEVAVIEAMKMEHRLRAAVDGTVATLRVDEGQQVAAGAVLMEIEGANAD
jgi:geranyl-CoA carboxylase alpha subunit